MKTTEQIIAEAAPCPCGGRAQFHIARNHGDTPHLYCSNHRCGRIVPAVYRTIAETVEIWNREIQQEACVHSWFRQDNGVFRCPHCGKTHDHVAEQSAVMDKLLSQI